MTPSLSAHNALHPLQSAIVSGSLLSTTERLPLSQILELSICAGRLLRLLRDPPRPGAVFFVIAWPLVHDEGPVCIPKRIFIIRPRNRLGPSRKCIESSFPRHFECDRPLSRMLIYRLGLLPLHEILGNFNDGFSWLSACAP